MLYLGNNWLFYGICKGFATFSLGCGVKDYDQRDIVPAPSLVIAIFKFCHGLHDILISYCPGFLKLNNFC